MSVLKTFQRPQNHQDFELLCKMLLEEHWRPLSIKRHGRNGQRQRGVDIIAQVTAGDGWYGVQCKAGDQRSINAFSENEIDKTIKEALDFEPKLSRFYLFTTAPKDASIEDYVRKRSIAHSKQGLFSIDIFSWGDIEDLLQSNPKTRLWYLKGNSITGNKSVSVTFDDGKTSIICKPCFEQKTLHYIQAIIPDNYYSPFIHLPPVDNRNIVPKYLHYCKNYAYCGLKIRLRNTGDTSLEQVTIRLEFIGKIADLRWYNETGARVSLPNPKDLDFTFLENHILKIDLRDNILVPDNEYISNQFFLKPDYTEKEIIIRWTVLTVNYKAEGKLNVALEPDIKHTSEEVLVDDPFQVRVIRMNVEDYCEGWG